jgi:hypothetical protein
MLTQGATGALQHGALRREVTHQAQHTHILPLVLNIHKLINYYLKQAQL